MTNIATNMMNGSIEAFKQGQKTAGVPGSPDCPACGAVSMATLPRARVIFLCPPLAISKMSRSPRTISPISPFAQGPRVLGQSRFASQHKHGDQVDAHEHGFCGVKTALCGHQGRGAGYHEAVLDRDL